MDKKIPMSGADQPSIYTWDVELCDLLLRKVKEWRSLNKNYEVPIEKKKELSIKVDP